MISFWLVLGNVGLVGELKAMGRLIRTFDLLFLGLACVAAGWFLTLKLTPESKRNRIILWLSEWSVKGLLVPLLVWALLNIGLSFELQPFMPPIQAAKNAGRPWAWIYFSVVVDGLFLIGSYWSAMTLGWVMGSATVSAEKRAQNEIKNLFFTALLGLGIPVLLLLYKGRLFAAGFAFTLLLSPVAGYSRDILCPPKLPPRYSKAIARLKFGKWSEAEWEIINELEKAEDDFEGWMMLAELYANHFRNISEAEQTVMELCGQPTTSASQVSVALHRLADWHLNIGENPENARRALELIRQRFPGTHLAHMAQLRIDQLPVSSSEFREARTAHSIPLPALGDQLDSPVQDSGRDIEKSRQAADACVTILTHNPNNVAVRERLARIFSEQMGRPDLGIEQIELLLNMPDRSEEEKASWFGLIAAWHLRYTGDGDKARSTLEQIVRDFPQSVQAVAARRRLELLSRKNVVITPAKPQVRPSV